MMEVSTRTSDGSEVRIAARDGRLLSGRWRADPEALGTLVIAHGLGEHGGCYDHVAEALGEGLRLSVLSFDFRGHGRSPGRRGCVRHYEELVDDLRRALDWAGAVAGDLPRFVLGHSNGGQVAIRLAQAEPEALDGIILSNPSLRLRLPIPRWKGELGQFLRRSAPWFTLATDLGDHQCVRDPSRQVERREDPLRHSRISAPLFFGMVEGGERLIREAPRFRTPALLLLGEADPVIDPRATTGWFDGIASPVKDVRRYPEALHEPLNDHGRDQVIEDIRAWLAPRLATSPSPRT